MLGVCTCMQGAASPVVIGRVPRATARLDNPRRNPRRSSTRWLRSNLTMIIMSRLTKTDRLHNHNPDRALFAFLRVTIMTGSTLTRFDSGAHMLDLKE